MKSREELHRLVDQLGDDEIDDALEYLRWLTAESETLAEGEMELVRQGEEEIAQGQYVRLADIRARQQ